MGNIHTVKSASKILSRCESFIRAGLKLNKIRGLKVGNTWIIDDEEVRRLEDDPITISRQEMLDAVGEGK